LKRKQQAEVSIVERSISQASVHENIFDLFNTPEISSESKELEVYVKNMDRLPGPVGKDPKSILVWWKV
jgi:hypothetical protein